MGEKPKTIIFTDLDGTLLDLKTYSYKTVLPEIRKIKRKNIPIIFCTAKTQAENEYYRKKLKIIDPFIVENGGAIFIPKNYFSFKFNFNKASKKYFIIELGVSYKKLRKALGQIRKETKFKIIGFGDMTARQVSKDAQLPLALAKLAKKREYDESFKFLEKAKKEKILFKKIKQKGFMATHGGRYFNILGKQTDKGKAAKILIKLFKKEFAKIQTIGLGDSQNDLPMLKVVDLPILVQKPSGIWSPHIKLKGLIKIKRIGPRGWKTAIQKYVR